MKKAVASAMRVGIVSVSVKYKSCKPENLRLATLVNINQDIDLGKKNHLASYI